MNNKHSTFYADEFKPITFCGKNIGFIFKGSRYVKPIDVKPLKIWKHNLDTCNSCKSNYEQVIKEKTTQLIEFPFCCEYHNKLIKEKWL